MIAGRSVEDALFKLLIYRNLKTIRQPVVHIGDANDAHQLAEHRLGHPLVDRRRSVRGNAVLATVADADGEVDQFADQRIEFAGPPHHFLQRLPGPL